MSLDFPYFIYTFGELLGNGAFSEVRACSKKGSKKRFAVKFFVTSSDDESPSLCYPSICAIQEIGILKNLSHSNIISIRDVVYKFSEEEKYLGMVMERGDTTLYTYINRPFQPGLGYKGLDVQLLAMDIMSGLHYLHSNNVIHRDIKPSNIIIKNERAKIADFSSCKLKGFQSSDVWTDIVTTLPYRAPEVLLGQPYDEDCDIWSAGMTILHALFGLHLPFDSSDQSEDFVLKEIYRYFGPPPDTWKKNQVIEDWFIANGGIVKKSFLFEKIKDLKLKVLIEECLTYENRITSKEAKAMLIGLDTPFIYKSIVQEHKVKDYNQVVSIMLTSVASYVEKLFDSADHHKHRFLQMCAYVMHNTFLHDDDRDLFCQVVMSICYCVCKNANTSVKRFCPEEKVKEFNELRLQVICRLGWDIYFIVPSDYLISKKITDPTIHAKLTEVVFSQAISKLTPHEIYASVIYS